MRILIFVLFFSISSFSYSQSLRYRSIAKNFISNVEKLNPEALPQIINNEKTLVYYSIKLDGYYAEELEYLAHMYNDQLLRDEYTSIDFEDYVDDGVFYDVVELSDDGKYYIGSSGEIYDVEEDTELDEEKYSHAEFSSYLSAKYEIDINLAFRFVQLFKEIKNNKKISLRAKGKKIVELIPTGQSKTVLESELFTK